MVPDPAHAPETMRLGHDVELDLRARRLSRAGRVLKLERIPAEILLLLVERAGQLVTRQEIVDRIWGQGVFLDTDNSINGAIRKIRQTLNDDAEQPRFVETITGRGYRYIGPVHVRAESEPTVAVESVTPQPARRRWLLGAAAVLGVGALAGIWLLSARSTSQPPAQGRLMLAVLPFENLTGDAGQDYFSDGLTEEIIIQIGRLNPERLGVIARASVQRYKRNHDGLAAVARELGVQYALEGSVRRGSERLRVAVRLIQVHDQTLLWSQEYDRKPEDLLGIQAEIAHAVASEIPLGLDERHAAMTPHAGPSPPAYEAYDLYLKGRYFWNKRTPEGFQQAIGWFEQAIARDPKYARAYAGLADSYALIASWLLATPAEVIPKARAAALKALEIDPNLAEAHTSLALITQNHDWDWRSAEKEFRRAIELDPNYVTGHHWYAEHLAFQGRFDEALAEIDRARRLDPLSLIIATDTGAILFFARQYDRAIEEFRAVLAVEPTFGRASIIAFAYLEKGQVAEALAQVDTMVKHVDGPWPWAYRAHISGRAGRMADAQRALQKMQQTAGPAYLPVLYSTAYVGMGRHDEALAWLEKAYRDRSHILVPLKVEPLFDPLRSDPRFQDLLRRVGLGGK
jgi:TolB-like protein/DNA-binding winged helix-turn-helix (wHTH) protein/Tfp pilus assembly protein PilF